MRAAPFGPCVASSAFAFGCSPTGDVWYYFSTDKAPGVYRCVGGTCEVLTSTPFSLATISPDGQRIALVGGGTSGLTVSWMSSSGGPIRGVAPTETGCEGLWSSGRNLWVSRRRDGGIYWVEIDTDTLAETGRVVEGAQDCSRGGPDPRQPVVAPVRVESKAWTEIRLVPNALLER